ncbi:MAG: PAS domain S-box protein, partial [Rufibacter sp.]
DALRPLSDALEIQSAAMRVLGEELQVDRVLYAEMEDNGETYHIKVNYVRGAFTPHLGRFPASDVGAASEGLRAGETFVIGNTTEDERLSQTARATFLAHGVYATMGVPLVKAGCWVANLGIQHGEARQWTEENIALVKETAERTWAAVERAKAEEAMRASDQRLSKLLSLMPAGVYTCDAGGRITYYNQRAVELWGREPKLGDGQDRFCGAFRLWQPDGSPILHVQTAMAEAVEKGVSFRNLEVMLEQPNGTRLIANVNIDPLFDGEGKIMGAINVFVDITERKKAEEALQQSEEKYRTLFDSMDEGYCIIKILFNEKNEPYDWVFEEVNPAFEKNNGLHNATGKTIRELAPTIEAKWFEIYGHVASTGQPNRFEEDSAALNRWFSLYAFRVGLPEDRRVAVLFNDITQRKKSEAALIKSEEQFRQAIQDAPIPIIMHAEDGEVLQISRTWTELTGYHPDDVPTFEHWLTQAYGEGANMVREHIQQLFKEDKKNLTIDFPVQTRAKGLRHWSFSASSPGTLRDGRRFIVGMAVDITERKQSEEKLRDFNKTLEKQVTERTLELRQSRDMLQSLFDTTLLSFSILKAVRDEKGAIVDFRIMVTNKELERETGRTDLVGKLYAEEYPGIKQTGLFDVMLQVMETGEPGQMDYYYPHENFNKWYSAMFVKMDDGLVASNLGITARKAAEAELTRNFAILRQAEAVAGMGSWEFDYANNSFHWSEGMYHLFGLPVGSQKSPETYLEYVIVEDRLIAEKLVRTIQHYPQPLEETLRILVNQEIRTVKIKAIVWHDDANRPVRMLGVDVDVSEVKRLEQENLQIRLEQQKALLLAILEAQEEERRRISESLHNGVAQILYATKLNLGRAREHNLETGKIENQLLQTVEDLLTESIQETRRVSHELVPMLLQEFGLKVALESMCQKFEVSALFLRCEVEGLEQRLEPYLEIALFRMSQELVNNIVKHSGATAATITLRQKGNQILLQAKDNGRGIQKVSANQKGLGLRSIQDRVNLMNGTLSISTPKTGKGTLITIQVPAHD